ncbi:hypothetical protein K4K49_004280 [Colletotrichum sp. SAR 10_70]|nr:hypothetical protein K4K50_003351 [Colletotrichum sp. SAR 10_71]KAI8171383.1 hypothetical protein K4K49_004280 [Colletotrichum sp. SAR 10_70]KAI8175353.1 hypothetical protein KHU50_004269 [Colletotrichum sp. SAR 10_65]KAI8178195.1 hypothetical protein K4K51_004841 [Colletotrichum sp. SAR 10_75]KAI8232927.1 hypothetical protein K4K53_005004 [Colletotrichum sp. SAR 10_77]
MRVLRLLALSALAALGSSAPDISGLNWPANRALPLFTDSAKEIEYAKLTALSGEEQILLVSLQGLVNRRQPRLYLYWSPDSSNSDDAVNEAWLRQIESQGFKSADVTSEPFQLVDKYKSDIRGAIVYDTKLPDTINLASTLAGLYGAVIASEELARRLNISIIEDLRGRFKDKYELYEYAARSVWPKVTDRLITAIKPISTVLYANRTWETLLKANSSVTDSSNNGTYTADLSRFINRSNSVYVNITDAFPADGFGPSVYRVQVTADNQTVADFRPGDEAEDAFLFDDGGSHLADYPGGWRFADGSAAMIYKFDYPRRATQLTLTLSMWNQYLVSASADRPGYQKVNSIFRDYIVGTAAPCIWLDSNRPREAALLDKLLRQFQPNAAYLGWFPNGDEMTGVTQLAKNVFLSLIYLEGDNLQYDQRAMFTHWNDPERGSVPLGWTISPLLRDIGPGILSYYQRTATKNDLLIAGPDGAGYTYPGVWPKRALSDFLAQSGEYVRETRTDSVLFVYDRINATDNPLTPELTLAFQNAVGKQRLRGILYGSFVSTLEALQVNVTEAFPVTNVVSIGNEDSGAATLKNISDSYKGRGPLFVAGAVSAFDVTPASVNSMVKKLGDDFAVVRPDMIPAHPPLCEIRQPRGKFVPLQQIPIRLNVASQHPPYPPRLHDLLDLQHDLGNAPLEPDDRASPALRSQRSKLLGAA